MCQLLGMNSATPTDFTYKFANFARRGGETDKHSDGWGLSFYEKNVGVRSFKDPSPAAFSSMAFDLTRSEIKSLNMIAHIRYATEGGVCLENVHPFLREMWGIVWCFAHNGDVPVFSNGEQPWIGGGTPPGIRTYHPVGNTDSEAIFCSLLNALSTKFKSLPSLEELHLALQFLCDEITLKDPNSTILNFLLTVGPHAQFAYSFPGARPGSKVWNGLYYTTRLAEQSSSLSSAFPRFRDCNAQLDHRVAVIATVPVTTDEEWLEFQKGELILFYDGIPRSACTAAAAAAAATTKESHFSSGGFKGGILTPCRNDILPVIRQAV